MATTTHGVKNKPNTDISAHGNQPELQDTESDTQVTHKNDCGDTEPVKQNRSLRSLKSLKGSTAWKTE